MNWLGFSDKGYLLAELGKAEFMKEKNKGSERKSYSYDSCITSILRLFCLLIIAIHFIASFFPKGRIWGINQWAYFSPIITFPVTFLALLFLWPSFNRFVLKIIKALISPLFGYMENKRYVWYSIFSLLFLVIFWVLRTKTHFLGDGYQILSNIETDQLAFKWTEPLESFLHLKAFHLGRSLFNLDAETLYAILSCVAGSIFIFLCFLFANFLGKKKSQKILVFLILISLGSIQLFFFWLCGALHFSFSFCLWFFISLHSLSRRKDEINLSHSHFRFGFFIPCLGSLSFALPLFPLSCNKWKEQIW